jgi:hypothetical protein
MVLSTSSIVYEQDFQLWLEQTIDLLKAKDFDGIDLEHLVDELESMSRRDKREILSRLDVILMHLLKWRYQPGNRCPSWESSIQNNRKEVGRIIEDSPSLREYPLSALGKAYLSARKDAARETQLPLEIFPLDCPFVAQEILNEEFWPE